MAVYNIIVFVISSIESRGKVNYNRASEVSRLVWFLYRITANLLMKL